LKRESLYLETSVISAYYDERDQTKLEYTRRFWNKLSQYEVIISTVVQDELEAIGREALRRKIMDLIKDFGLLEIGEEEEFLSNEYIKEGVIPEKYENDALQIAVATTNAVDFLVSWNLGHIVKVKTRRMVNLINLKHGYKAIEIITPSEL
jgi:predicted nucleic acid-binding protein